MYLVVYSSLSGEGKLFIESKPILVDWKLEEEN